MKVFNVCVVSSLLLLTVVRASQSAQAGVDENSLPNGYYNFAKAPPGMRPPKIRKPPYLPIAVDCPGVFDVNPLNSKNTLCGDINRGYIPRNPIGQMLDGQPYPFEIIKNKTLQFLSRSLPYLKKEIESIPKVARFVKPSDFFKQHGRYAREAPSYTDVNANVSTSSTPIVASQAEPSMPSDNNTAPPPVKLSRQSQCEGNTLCQALEALKEEGVFSRTFLNGVASAVGNVASLNSIVSLLDQYNQLSQHANTSGPLLGGQSHHHPSPTKFGLSQLLSSVSSMSDSSGTHNANGEKINSNAYSPLLSIIDYIQSLQAPRHMASKRKTPNELEDYLPPESSDKPQTPCMSSEEYISPTYARNYQGVWKYVVQIPNEGYFTQTVQQTTCLKSKCDLIEGACRESPRWVSLLVAEIFYPDVYFPANQMVYKQQQQQQTQESIQAAQPQHQHAAFGQAPAASAPQFQVIKSNHAGVGKRAQQQQQQQQQTMANLYNNLDLNAIASLLKRGDAIYDPAALHNVESLARRARRGRKSRAVDGPMSSATTENGLDGGEDDGTGEKKHCDGYDKIGCYQIRVYFDWFLINGNCKCWKSSGAGGGSGLNINETIKRIFIGKWKK